jgi:beta-glucosidase
MATTLRYQEAGLSAPERARDLLGRMTIAEKVAQLGSFWGFSIVRSSRFDPVKAAILLADGIGEITRIAGSTNLRPGEAVAVANDIQRYLLSETRLGIPAIVHEESLHGLLARDAPCFQQAIGAAASFDPELLGEVAGTIRRRMIATGARHALAPVLDLARDPRWGRIEETYGEDPYLAASMGIAYIRAIQGAGRPADETVIATGKHLVGHGLPEGGLNQAPAHIGWRELRDEQLLPFEAAIREADLGSVMPAYCEVDGIPCHMSGELLETILRGEWGFDGLVSSDYMGIEQIVRHHRLTDDLGEAAARAIEAGVDQELPKSVAYAEPLVRAIETGRVSEASVDASVARVLEAKFRLGLFERPFVDADPAPLLAECAPDEARLGRRLAQRSIVLLENDGILPLPADGRRVAVIGPIADSARDLLGDYNHLLHIETLREIRSRENAFGIEADVEIPLEDELAGRRTILDAIRDRFGAASVVHARGAGLQDGSDADIAEAAEIARAADVAILVVGERSGLTDDSTTGEFRDRRELGLIGRQQELLEAIVATGTPVILVVVSGRPLTMEWAAEHCAAILLAWVPGDGGPDAIADILAGDESPGGKLPVTLPRHVGQVPLTYRHHPSGGRSNPKGDYVDGSVAPLWPFGFGRSYTTFELSDLAIDSRTVETADGEVTVSVAVTNSGARAGDEVVQLYVRDEQALVARPVLELRGFHRVCLAPGEHQVVTFHLDAEQFAYTGPDYRRIVEPGTIRLFVGTSSADLPLEGSVELVGSTIEVASRRRFLTESTARAKG